MSRAGPKRMLPKVRHRMTMSNITSDMPKAFEPVAAGVAQRTPPVQNGQAGGHPEAVRAQSALLLSLRDEEHPCALAHSQMEKVELRACSKNSVCDTVTLNARCVFPRVVNVASHSIPGLSAKACELHRIFVAAA